VMENFFGLMNSEIHYNPKSPMPAIDLQAILERNINFYNNERIQKKLGYLSPVGYRKLMV